VVFGLLLGGIVVSCLCGTRVGSVVGFYGERRHHRRLGLSEWRGGFRPFRSDMQPRVAHYQTGRLPGRDHPPGTGLGRDR